MDELPRRWRYEIRSGAWFNPEGELLALGHAGAGEAMNDPSRARERSLGPIPPGFYALGPAELHPKTGPVSMRLYPLDLLQVLGRSPWSFLVHGPNATPDPADDSEGCPILARAPREVLAASSVRLVEVVEGAGPITIAWVEPEIAGSELAPLPPKPTS